MPVRAVVADDNDAFRTAVRDVLASSAAVELVAMASCGSATLAVVDEHRPDVVVVDVQMPGGGPTLVEELIARHPGLRVMGLSARDDADTVLAMLTAGANGYVAKGTLMEDLATCVRQCAAGTLFVMAACADEVRTRLLAADDHLGLPASSGGRRMH